MTQADVQGRVSAHGMAYDVRFGDAERVHHRDHIGAGGVLAVAGGIVGDIRGPIAALAIGDAAMRAAEAAHLRLPCTVVAGKFMDKDHGRACARFLVIEIYAVGGIDFGHRDAACPGASPRHAT